MSLEGVSKYLGQIDYAWNKPQTYMVLVPGLSTVILKIQLTNVFQKLHMGVSRPANIAAANNASNRYAAICKWHLRGSLLQTGAMILAAKVIASPILMGVLIAFPLFEMYKTANTALKYPVVIYAANGFESRSALNIF
jgi:hypothetical protein